jgi:short-subunit dehydrogenase
MDLAGAHVLITGASRGLGAGLARRFAQEGARVTLVARTREAIDDLAAELGGRALQADLLDAEQVAGLVARAEAAAGAPVDVLVNNAGLDATQPLGRFTHDELSRIAELNLVVPLELARQALDGMVARGRGHIVNMSSLAGTAVLPGMIPYAATKSALTHATSGLRAELRGLPVGTTVVEVGLVPTDMRDSVLSYGPTAAAFGRLYRLRALCDTPLDRVCRATVRAVAADRRHVRLPRRAMIFPLLAEAPRRIVELLTTGVRARD